MKRYVILFHQVPPEHPRGSHFDWMFETSDGLQTWATTCLPQEGEPGIPALQLPLHRAAYLDYEGPVSGNRGTVRRMQQGTYTRLLETPDLIRLQLDGQTREQQRLRQRLVFERERDDDWMLRSIDGEGT